MLEILFSTEDQERLVRLAMKQAEIAIRHGDEPFGVVLVDRSGMVVAEARNTAYSTNDLTAHAEINLIRRVQQEHGRGRFDGCAVFANAASCGMCASALIRAGLQNFYFGAPFEPRTNPAVSFEQLQSYCKNPLYIHAGILAAECVAQIERGREQINDTASG